MKKEAKWKDKADPLKQMESFLKGKKEIEEREERRKQIMEKEMTEREHRRGRGRIPENDDIRPRKHWSGEDIKEVENRHQHHEKHTSRHSTRKHHRHHHRRHRRSQSPAVDKNLELLRAERYKREAMERDKVANLMKKEKNNDRYETVGYGGYSAQFHPEAVR